MFSRPLKCIALFTLLFFSWTMGGGATIAHAAKTLEMQAPVQTEARTQAVSPEEQLNAILAEIESALVEPAGDLKDLRKELSDKLHEAKQLDLDIRKEFAETEKKLKKAGLSDVILKRHEDFVAHYDVNFKELRDNIQALVSSSDQESFNVASEKARNHFNKVKPPSKHQPLDPNNLPHRLAKPTKKQPRMKKKEFEQEIENDKNAMVNQRRIMVASTGSLTGLLGPDELAETIEIQFTPDIQAKAAELGHDPVKIYNWVRNNIEFVPTWGSIQGAQMALETKQGNAFDTASLLIALLRESGIKSRYVMGTVELPIDKVMNWVGDFTDPLSALDFMSSGGIPTKGLVADGEIVAARFEHVWVEAFIDYIPSRGAKHKVGDTWISLDTSYKLYTYTEGVDIESLVPINTQAFVDQIQASATINEGEAYATGFNSLIVQQTMQGYQAQVAAFIQENFPNATVSDVLGKKEIVKQGLPYLLGTLPYHMAVAGTVFDVVPDSLRHKLSFKVKTEEGTNLFDYTSPDPDFPEPVDMSLMITKSLPEVAGKKITLSYSPATAQDVDIISSYLPQPLADGSAIQPSELPSQLPAYLINVMPELRIDGQVVATGASIGLGGTNVFTMIFSDPTYGSSQVVNYIDAGVYQAIGLNLGRISQKQLNTLMVKLETTKEKLQFQNVAGLTKEDIKGDLLFTTAICYHAEVDNMNVIGARAAGVVSLSLPSETIFSTKLRVLTLWGIPRVVESDGLNMDADYLMQVAKAKDGNNETVRQYMLNSGMTSSMLEHEVPEQMFSTPDSPAYFISTAKALKIANDQGVPIYNINKNNLLTVLPLLQIDAQTKAEIQNVVNAGKVVTVSQNNINFNGWTGCAYTIIDPETGSGAYMLSGGLNGSVGALIGAALTGLLDALLAVPEWKRSIAPLFGELALLIGKALTAVGFAFTVKDIVMHDSLSPLQKSLEIATWLAATVALLKVVPFLAPILGPIFTPLFAVFLFVVVTVLTLRLINAIEKNVAAMRYIFRKDAHYIV